MTGAGSVWSNGATLAVGQSGSSNTLTISNGGTVFALDGYIGQNANNNAVTVTGAVVAGSTYAFSAFALGTQHTSNAIVTLTMTTDDSVISATIGEGLVTAGYQFSGSRTTLYTPATTRTTTFAVTYSTTAGTFSIAGGEVMVVRVS